MDRLRQLMSETLLYLFVFAVLTGGYLAFSFTPGGQDVVYDGSYVPLRGTVMSAAYDSILRISFDVPGGLLVRQLHHKAMFVLALGVVLQAVLARNRYAFAALGLTAAAAAGGYGAADDLLYGTFLARVPALWWYALHLLVAAATGAVLVAAVRQEAAREPRSAALVAAAAALTALTLWWL